MTHSQQPPQTVAPTGAREAMPSYAAGIQAEPGEVTDHTSLILALLLAERAPEAQTVWLSVLSQQSASQQQNSTLELIQFLATTAEQYEQDASWKNAWLTRSYIAQFLPNDINNSLILIRLAIELKIFEQEGRRFLASATHSLAFAQGFEQVNLNLLEGVLQKLAAIHPFHELFDICFLNDNIRQNPQFNTVRNQVAIAHNNLGLVFHQQGSLDQAFGAFRRCLEIQASISPVHLSKIFLNLGVTSAQKQQFQSAETYLKQAVELDANNADAARRLVDARYKLHTAAKSYTFTSDWFSFNIPTWQVYLQQFVGQPNLTVLEIGSWEGRSTCWLLEDVLTHPSSTITCVDTFEGSFEHQSYDPDYIKSLEDRFDFNIQQSGASERVKKIVGSSHRVLKSLPPNTYDFIYIDGSHLACDVLIDAVLSWPLVKVQGLLVFDDYDFRFPNQPNQNTQIGIDAFVSSFSPKIEIIHKGHQLILRKLAE
ncbi:MULTISPECIES: class I SAM-dependent methyltransferase [Trichocoleus]|uniref:Class I SAM-dependent methyltransferase n=1 Tax=Trichocoleus desertorum GB2-A4 TaxID=2933944 RepID=A0ABV0J9Y3_9CYAN|nr:class I SAM-dependent methyltransferase [Trichocoleus sp. FACHB-46]MBD1862931.1 class I SAM-dependent methyltransferase [Trichocoleus sp. FACHB-46]